MTQIGMRKLLSFTRRAVDDYAMIAEGDHIAVGLSGGKDSLSLLAALAALRRFYPKRFSLGAITLDMGYKGADFSPLADFCRELETDFHLIPTEIAHVIFEARKESNPCSLCAKMRRGVLNETARELGYHKVALGHHYDDLIETFLLNLIHEGRLGAFSPVTYLSRSDITVIRPLLYTPEKYIRYYASKNQLPVYKNPCPADKHTERETMKSILSSWERDYKGVKHRMFGAMKKANLDGLADLSPDAPHKRFPPE